MSTALNAAASSAGDGSKAKPFREIKPALDKAPAGSVVLLAPGGTSFDAFGDFAERGDRFQALVRAL